MDLFEKVIGALAKAKGPMPCPTSMFTVELPPAKRCGSWLGLLVGGAVVGGFTAIGIFALKDAGFFRYLWLGFNGLFALLMLIGVVGAIRNAGVTIRVCGDRSEIRVQRMKGRRRISEKRIPRDGTELRPRAGLRPSRAT